MNRTIRTLIITAPLAAAFTFGTGAALAETPPNQPGPVIVLPAEPDPKPLDFTLPSEPEPELPQDKAPVPPKDEVPQDKAPVPQDDDEPDLPLDNGDNGGGTDPEGPGEVTNPTPCPTHGECQPEVELDQGCFTGCDLPEEPVLAPTAEKAADVVRPTVVHAGLPGIEQDQQEENGFDLTWLLVGGLVVTASGAAYAARSRSRHEA